MAEISITSVVGIGEDFVERILVEGTSRGCEYIVVIAECGDVPTTVTVLPIRGVDFHSTWSASLFVKGCGCDKDIVVIAKCDGSAMGDFVAEDRREERLICEAGCPRIRLSATVGGCDRARFRRVDYAIAFSPPLPPGTTAQVSWAYGGPNASNATVTQQSVNVAGSPLASLTHATSLAPRVQPYSSTATVALQIPGSEGFCFATEPVPVTVASCLPCPSESGPVTLTIDVPAGPGWCAPVTGAVPRFTAIVNWPAGISNPPAPSRYFWTVTRPDGTAAFQSTPDNSVSAAAGWTGAGAVSGAVDLSRPGTYSVGVSLAFPPGAGLPTQADGTASCNLGAAGSFTLTGCGGDAPCPSLSGIQVDAGCFDAAGPGGANVTFTATVSDPRLVGGLFTWDFGDGTRMTTGLPSAAHTYASAGQFTVTVTIAPAGPCRAAGPSSLSTLVAVPLCARDEPRDDAESEEGPFCYALRLFAIVFLAAALVCLLVAVCMAEFAPALVEPLLWTALVLAIVGALLLAAWALFCPKPCYWFLLFIGQIFAGVGWLAIYFGTCCAWLWVLGVLLVIVGVVALLAWRVACELGWCRFLKELAFPLLILVLPTLGVLVEVAEGDLVKDTTLFDCLNGWVVIGLNILVAAISVGAVACRDR